MSKENKRKLSKAEAEAKAKRRADLVLALKTIISNDACIQVSREWRGFKGHGVPIIIAVLSVLLAIIPSFVSRITVNAGDSFLGAPSYNYNVGLADFTSALNKNNVHVKINDFGVLTTEGDLATVFNYPASEDEKANEGTTDMKWYRVTTDSFEEQTTVFEVFINDKADLNDADFFSNVALVDGTSKTPDGKYRAKKLSWNYLAIGKTSMVFAKYNPSKGTLVTYLNGQYDLLAGSDLTALASPSDATLTGYAFLNECGTKWKSIINKSYETQKIYSTFSYVGILSSIYVGLIALFGFLIWVMTRGKNNPLRVYKIWQTQRMSYWASFSPAVISIAVGFFLRTSPLGMFAFIFIFGMRLMWMSMRALRPVQ